MSQAANPPPTMGWEVTSQPPRSQVNSAGQIVQGFQINFTAANGQTGSVWVPESDYNVETVRALIAAKVATIEGIANLTGA